MAYITFTEAYKIAGISRATAQRRVKQLKKFDLDLYNKLIIEGRPMMVEATQGVAYFRTNIHTFKKKLITINMKPGPKKSKKAEPFPEDAKEMLTNLLAQPVVLEVEPDEKAILKSVVDQAEQDRLILVIKVCYDYAAGYDTLESCITRYGCDPSNFYRWLRNSPHLTYVYRKAKSERTKTIKERGIERAIDVIDKLMNGFIIQLSRKRYKVETNSTGKEILIPESVEITDKYFPPHFGAAVFKLINRDPKNWRRDTPFEELFYDKEKLRDRFDNMSNEELQEFIKEGRALLNKNK